MLNSILGCWLNRQDVTLQRESGEANVMPEGAADRRCWGRIMGRYHVDSRVELQTAVKILILSPVPTHPSIAGNRARVSMLARALKDNGHEVHFAFIPMEDGDVKSMAAFFDDKLTILPYRPTKGHARFFPRLKRYALRKLGSARAHVWGVDDWYDDGLSRAVADLYARERFDAAIAVYVFVSKALEALPDTVLKIVDTNDRFADRHLEYIRAGRKPAWFSTTPDEERRGLARAHVVLAIQDGENRLFSHALKGAARVVTVGHILPVGGVLQLAGKPGAVFVGSINPINVDGVSYFVREVLPLVRAVEPAFELWLVGDICSRVEDAHGVVKHGRIEDLSQVYAGASLAVNPVRMGTGLNIKTVECLALGLPLVVTEAGGRGLEAFSGRAFVSVRNDDPAGMADAILAFLRSPELAARYAREAHAAAKEWNRLQCRNLLGIFEGRGDQAVSPPLAGDVQVEGISG